MKKLMIAAAVVCAAIASQAASASWVWSTNTAVLKDAYNKADDLKGSSYSPVAMANATTYLFLAGNATATTSKDDLNATLSALREGTAVTAISGYTGQSTTTDSDGKILTADAVKFTYDAGTAVNDKAFFYEVVVVDDYAFISGLSSVTTPDTGKDATITTLAGTSATLKDQTGTADWTGGGWYATVPEPTSGLLLLLGVAGLSLRRRRA